MIRRLRNDRGALMNALMFVTVSLIIVSGMAGWLLTRMQIDANALGQAQLRSAVNVYSDAITSKSNQQGVNSVKVGDKQTFPSLNATVQITKWTAGANGAWTLGLTATATQGLNVGGAPRTQDATVTLSASGAAVYTGIDPTTKRPTWIQSTTPSTNLPPLALRVLSPTSVVFR